LTTEKYDENVQKFLIPLPGMIVRHPRLMTPLPPAGALCEWTGPDGRYWRRRVKDGSCVIASLLEQADVE